MRFGTFSVLVGGLGCNAKCPHCVAKVTPTNNIDKCAEINFRNFDIACELAESSQIPTMLFTGKGEPTLYPHEITNYLQRMKNNNVKIPIKELQTNGVLFKGDKLDKELERWHKHGLTTISISIVHYRDDLNEAFLGLKKYQGYDLIVLIAKLHKFGYSVRLSCVSIKDHIDTISTVDSMVNFARANKVEQLTIRKLGIPNINSNSSPQQITVHNWCCTNSKLRTNIEDIDLYFQRNAVKLDSLPFGATVYDYNGQNICITNCLTLDTNHEQKRQLIFFPDGHLRYDWQYSGAIII